MGRKKISQTDEERIARMNYLRTKEGIIGERFVSASKSVESVRDMMKDICRVKGAMYQVDLKDVYIRAVMGSEQLLDRLYFYAQTNNGTLVANSAIAQQLANELQFHDWLLGKLDDFDKSEYQSFVQRFGEAPGSEKPKPHRGRYSKEERAAIDLWNKRHPEDPFINQYEQRTKPKLR